jgi:hypothetical protein
MEDIGKILLIFGLSVTILGAFLVIGGRIPGFGRLPGDLIFQTENFSCMIPLATSIILSLVLTLLLNLLLRLINR